MDEANGWRIIGKGLARLTLPTDIVTPVLSTVAVGHGGDLHMEL